MNNLLKLVESLYIMSKPERNMYGCLPCPDCGSVYRAPYRTSKAAKQLNLSTIECDDCGRIVKAEPSEYEQDWNECI